MSDDKYLLRNQPCARCGSSDAKSYYIDGGSKCFSCGVGLKHDSPDGVQKRQPARRQVRSKVTVADVANFPVASIPSRGISEAICGMFGVKEGRSEQTGQPDKWYYPYYAKGEIVGYKVRPIKDKDFFSIGKQGKESELFGWHRVSEGGKLLIIVEGENDALAATEMLKSKGKSYKVVSITTGAASAGQCLKANLNKLDKFETIMLNFDNDEAGQLAQKECSDILRVGQVSLMTLPEEFKDANDILLNGKAYQYLDAINNAKKYRPDGIVAGEDTWELYEDRPPVTSYPFPEDWVETNKMTYGIRLNELDVFTSGTSAGKTQTIREIVYHYAASTGLKTGILSLEEPLTDTIESYIELALNKRISLPDVESTKEERRRGWEETLGSGNIMLYDAFGGEEDRVMSIIRYMAKGSDCKLIVIDHLHMLLDGKGPNKDQVERIMLTLKKLTQELGIWIGLIAHLRKSDGKSFEEGGIAKLDDLKDSSTIKQLANGVYILGRDQQADDPITRNTTQLVVGKCRFTGRTGYADRLLFDDDTGRMNILKPDEIPY